METNLIPSDPKVIEMSFTIFERILTSIDFTSKDELLKLADVMIGKVNDKKYPEVLQMAYAEAKRKIEALNLEQLDEIKQIILAEE